MSLSLQGLGQPGEAVPSQQANSSVVQNGAFAPPAKEAPAVFGSSPAAVVSVSAQAKAAQAKAAQAKALQAKGAQVKVTQAQALAAQARASAIKNGQDPDGVQDGK